MITYITIFRYDIIFSTLCIYFEIFKLYYISSVYKFNKNYKYEFIKLLKTIAFKIEKFYKTY